MTLKLKPKGELKMGLTHVVVRLFNFADSENKYEADFLVDTGCMYTMAPATKLKQVGIQPDGKEVYELASGEHVEYEYGSAKLEFMGEVIPARIIFGPDESAPLLGVIALETAGYLVDPTNQALRRLEAFPLKRVA